VKKIVGTCDAHDACDGGSGEFILKKNTLKKRAAVYRTVAPLFEE
jgi:hypothetical protein